MSISVSSFDEVPKKTFAEWVNLTTRQITNLQEEGLPVIVKGTRVFVQWPAGLHWYHQRLKEERNAGTEEKAKLTTRRLELEVAMAELELAKEQGNVVALDYMEEQLAAPLERLRAKLLNAPGKYAPSLVGLRTIAESQVRLEGII